MNDERPIEKLLRRYAQRRRDEAGAPPELHPATRRLLQGEVARQFPKPAGEAKGTTPAWFAIWSRRWIYALGLFVVLCLSTAVLFPTLLKSKQKTDLAQGPAVGSVFKPELSAAPTMAPATPAPAAAPMPAVLTEVVNEPAPLPSGGGNVRLARNEAPRPGSFVTNGLATLAFGGVTEQSADFDARRKLDNSATATLGATVNPAATATKVATAPPTPTRSAGTTVALAPTASAETGRTGRLDETAKSESLWRYRQPATDAPTAPATAGVASRALQDKVRVARGGGVEKNTERVYSQAFANIATDEFQATAYKVKTVAAAPVTPVLANFQVEQTGNRLRVIDGDGSTYLGEMSPTAVNYGVAKEQLVDELKLAVKQELKKSAGLQQQKAQDYFYRVAGTNRTLQQQVVFTWNYVELTNILAGSDLKASSAALNKDYSKLPSQLPALQNSFINGRAQLGAGKEIEINAVPVSQ